MSIPYRFRINLIALVLSTASLQGCHSTEEYIVLKRIINDTPCQVSIGVYTTEAEHQFDVEALDTLTLAGKCYFGPLVYCGSDWSYSFSWSELIFDGLKMLSFSDECADGAASIAWDPFECAGYEEMDIQITPEYTFTASQPPTMTLLHL